MSTKRKKNENKNEKKEDERNKGIHVNTRKNDETVRAIKSTGFNYQERRRQADWVLRAVSILSFVSWFMAIAVLILLFISDDYSLIPVGFIMMILSVAACVAAFIFNVMRMRRNTDKYKISIIIIGVLTSIGLIVYSFSFARYLF